MVGLAASATAFVVSAPLAWAQTPLEDAVEGLAGVSVWAHPDSGRLVDASQVAAVIGDRPVKIAVLPAGPAVSEVRLMPRQLARHYPGHTVAVVSGRYFYAGSDVLCADEAGRAASSAIAVNEEALDSAENSDITDALVDFASAVGAAPTCAQDEPDRTSADDDTGTVLAWVAGGLAAVAAVVLAWVTTTRRQSRANAASAEADAIGAVEALSTALEDLPEEAAPEARARLAEAQTLLAGATTADQFRTVHELAGEGGDLMGDPGRTP